MKQDRRRPKDVTPDYEDAGLFANGTCDVMVSLVPVIRRNGRDDVIVTGYVNQKREVTVNFAGRRKGAVAPITEHLEKIHAQTRLRAIQHGLNMPPLKDMRVLVRVEGTWRAHTIVERDGWESRRYELMAARWSVVDKNGDTVFFGEPPRNWPKVRTKAS